MSIYYYSYCEQCNITLFHGASEFYSCIRHEIFSLYHSTHQVSFYNEFEWERKWVNVEKEPSPIGYCFDEKPVIKIPRRVENYAEAIDVNTCDYENAAKLAVLQYKEYIIENCFDDYKNRCEEAKINDMKLHEFYDEIFEKLFIKTFVK